MKLLRRIRFQEHNDFPRILSRQATLIFFMKQNREEQGVKFAREWTKRKVCDIAFAFLITTCYTIQK